MVVTFTNRVGGASQQLIPTARAIFIADAYRGDGKRYVVRADEMLAAFLQPRICDSRLHRAPFLKRSTTGRIKNERHNLG